MSAFIIDFFATNIGKLFALDIGIQWLAFIFANYLKTEKFYDLTGSLTFLSSLYLSLQWSEQSARQTTQSRMVMFWATRLGIFLFSRVIADGKDKRFDKIKQSSLRFFSAWTIQGFWVFITSLPTLMLNDIGGDADLPLATRDYVGWAIWVFGIGFELLADYQKHMFRMNPDNRGKFITSGLWSISRHPNYFGEILLWFGLFVSASSVFQGWQHLAILSPVFVYLLITKLSGVPMLEKAGLKRWGELPEYQRYLANTPCLVPFTN